MHLCQRIIMIYMHQSCDIRVQLSQQIKMGSAWRSGARSDKLSVDRELLLSQIPLEGLAGRRPQFVRCCSTPAGTNSANVPQNDQAGILLLELVAQ